MAQEMTLKFPAMRGKMGGETYYVAMVKFKNVPTLFDTYMDRKVTQADEKSPIDMASEAQRRLSLKRIPEISDYILQNRKRSSSGYGYVFNSITANSEGNLKFTELKKGTDLGQLSVSDFDKFTVADGQHRLLGIKRALADSSDKSLREETVAVVFIDVRDPRTKQPDIKRMHQVFTDLNRNAQKVQGGVLAFMGHKPNEIIARRLYEEVALFEGAVELEKNYPSPSSENIFSLKLLKDCTDILFGPNSSKADVEKNLEVSKRIWIDLSSAMKPWNDFKAQKLDAKLLKTKYVCTHAVVVRSLIHTMARVSQLEAAKKSKALRDLSQFEWKKSNFPFRSKILTEGGGIINNKTAERNLTTS